MGSRSLYALGVVFGSFVLAPSLAVAAPPATATASAPSAKPAAAKPSVKNGNTAPNAKNANATAKANASATTRASSDTNVRRSTAGGPTFDDGALGADTPELRALYAAERELFPPASATVGSPWPQELPFPITATEDRPRVHSSGLPPAPALSERPHVEGPRDMAWLSKLDMPDLPVRWDARVIRYLEFFKDDPLASSWFVRK